MCGYGEETCALSSSHSLGASSPFRRRRSARVAPSKSHLNYTHASIDGQAGAIDITAYAPGEERKGLLRYRKPPGGVTEKCAGGLKTKGRQADLREEGGVGVTSV